tara:strand:+ start:287 stop:2359 length:2073 start_codon:yes stop_codon:yes gene_type:complete
MAESINNTIKTTVELDVNAAQQSIVKLNSLASDSTEELSTRLDAKNKSIELQNKLNKKNIADAQKLVDSLKSQEGAEKQLEAAQKKLNKAKLDEVKANTRNEKSQKKLASQYENSQGAVNKLDRATGGMITRLRALAASPIVLFVTILAAGLALLKKAFTSSEEGQNKFAKGLAIVESVIGNIMDLIAGFANMLVDAFTNPQQAIKDFSKAVKENITNRFDSAIETLGLLGSAIKKVFSGDFGGAIDDAKKAGSSYVDSLTGIKDSIDKAKVAITQFSAEIEKDAKIAANISDQRAKADKIDRDLIVERATANRDRADALNKSVDKEKFNVLERIEFLKEAGRIEDEITAKEILSAKIRLQAKVDENGLALSNKEALEQEATLKAKIIELETAKLTKAKEVTGQIVAFNAEQKAADDKIASDKKAKQDKEDQDKLDKRQLDKDNATIDREQRIAQDELDLEYKRGLGERVLADELALLQKKKEQELSVEGLRLSEIATINKKYNAEALALKKIDKKTTEEVEKAKLNNVINGAAAAFGISQELAVAKMLMAAPESIGNVWSQAAKQPTIPQVLLHGIAGTAIVAAPIIQGLKQIKSTRFSKSKGGGGGGGAISIPRGGSGSVPTATTSEISDISARNSARVGDNVSIGNSAAATASANVSASSSGNVIFSESAYTRFRDQVGFKEDKSLI